MFSLMARVLLDNSRGFHMIAVPEEMKHSTGPKEQEKRIWVNVESLAVSTAV